MIVSVIDCYRDIATRDKLIFPLAITHILSLVHDTIPLSSPFFVIDAINKESIRRMMLPLPPVLHLLLHLLLLLEWRCPLLPLWTSFSTCVLILVVVITTFLMRCVRWTPGLVALLTNSLGSFAPSPSPKPVEDSFDGRVDGDDASISSSDDEMIAPQWFTLCHSWQKGGVVLYMRVVLLLGVD